jgi:hypothetical protein
MGCRTRAYMEPSHQLHITFQAPNKRETHVHLHDRCAVMAPPMSGPMPLPQATAAPMKPLYLPRCWSVVTSLAVIMTRAVLQAASKTVSYESHYEVNPHQLDISLSCRG